MESSRRAAGGGTPTCPPWCTSRHGVQSGEEDHIHHGGALAVKERLLRLCATVDPDTGLVDGPYVYYGGEELSLHEAEALIAALTQLVEQGSGVNDLEARRRRSAGP